MSVVRRLRRRCLYALRCLQALHIPDCMQHAASTYLSPSHHLLACFAAVWGTRRTPPPPPPPISNRSTTVDEYHSFLHPYFCSSRPPQNNINNNNNITQKYCILFSKQPTFHVSATSSTTHFIRPRFCQLPICTRPLPSTQQTYARKAEILSSSEQAGRLPRPPPSSPRFF